MTRQSRGETFVCAVSIMCWGGGGASESSLVLGAAGEV
jgi:hypothetical protein